MAQFYLLHPYNNLQRRVYYFRIKRKLLIERTNIESVTHIYESWRQFYHGWCWHAVRNVFIKELSLHDPREIFGHQNDPNEQYTLKMAENNRLIKVPSGSRRGWFVPEKGGFEARWNGKWVGTISSKKWMFNLKLWIKLWAKGFGRIIVEKSSNIIKLKRFLFSWF